jgi:hypothetical protein
MAKTDPDQLKRSLALTVEETGSRIRRYTLDDKLDETALATLGQVWDEWLAVRAKYHGLADAAGDAEVRAVEQELLKVDRKVDLVQRKLISAYSFQAGKRTSIALAAALMALAVLYLAMHGVRGLDFSDFEPLAEWGPLKYVEVAFWSAFGVLCWLLFTAAAYVSRRDFDKWYQPWYLATALRAPFLCVAVMILVLEFVEWYAEDGWLQSYLLEDGNKFYFIVLVSFCLGLASDQAAGTLRDLSDGLWEFIREVVKRFTRKLRSGLTPENSLKK